MLTAVLSLKSSSFFFFFFKEGISESLQLIRSVWIFAESCIPLHHPISVPSLSPCSGREGTNSTQSFLLFPSPFLFLRMLHSRELSQVPHSTLQTPPSPWPAPDHSHIPLCSTATCSQPAQPVGGKQTRWPSGSSRTKICHSGDAESLIQTTLHVQSQLIVPNTDTPVCNQISEEG